MEANPIDSMVPSFELKMQCIRRHALFELCRRFRLVHNHHESLLLHRMSAFLYLCSANLLVTFDQKNAFLGQQ